MTNKLQELLKEKSVILLDGAMGTMLQWEGLQPGERPELFLLEHPDIVTEIHKAYLNSGSNLLYTCTFGANRRKLSGTGHTPSEVIHAAVQAAKAAADSYSGRRPLIALDIGPIGEMMYPSGMLHFEEAYDIFREVVIAGEEAGADLVVFETMTDLGEIRAAVLAARENTSLPVMTTMTFEENGRTFTGCTAEAMAYTMDGMGVDALGVNCSLGPEKLYPIAERIAACTDLPLIVKANAGLPDPVDNTYHLLPEDFALQMEKFSALGVRLAGGCCGTTPDFIRALQKRFENLDPIVRKKKAAICSPLHTIFPNEIHVIGERINPTGKKELQQALLEQDMDVITEFGMDQADAGAELLDVNLGYPGVEEAVLMKLSVEELQSVCKLPLVIDSADPAVLEAGLRAFHGIAIANSVTGEKTSLERILPVVKKYGAFVIGLTMDEKGIPQTAEERLAIAEKIVNTAEKYGIAREKILIDCLTCPVGAQQDQPSETLRAVRLAKEQLGVGTVLGVSNVSYGMPERETLNRSFLSAALENGLNFAILNPNEESLMDTITSWKTLHGLDPDAAGYLERFGKR
ncbi:MAG: homocysteine S-methyltransferase family protein [Candidatus Merdivicinus sp.]